MSDTPLSEILGSDDHLEPEIDVAEPPETIGQPRDEHGRFAPKGETEGDEPSDSAPPAPPVEAEPQHIPIAALKDERQKRQQLEARLAEYEAYLSQIQQQQQAPQAKPDMFADPEGYEAHLEAQITARLMQQLQPQLQQTQTLTRAEMSEFVARQKFEDYDAKIEVFKEALEANPFLHSQLMQAPDPATFAYNAANKYIEAKQYGTASPSVEQIEAQLREKIMAEIGMANRPKVPTTLAGDRSVGSRSGPAWSGPTPVSDIFSR
jgi:hypothetical protein